ncbi:CDP-glycerol glycerophosphotransferase family protein [Helicobacter sp. 23-1045]
MPFLPLIFAILLFSQNLNAYLDPGTGSLLLSSIVAIFASLLYFLKGAFYKIKMGGGSRRILSRKKSQNLAKNAESTADSAFLAQIPQNSIVIYAEDKRYYSLFKPIIDAFERLHYPYTYYTSDERDPMLEFQSNFGHIECIGADNKAFARLNSLEADICLMTTPQLDVLQLKRSKGVKHYCHILHSLPHIDNYEIFALDYFDSVFTNSPIHTDFLREVEKIRGLKHKQVAIVGCPYLDYLAEKVKDLRETQSQDKQTHYPIILVAPSWGREALLSKYGMNLLKPLLDSGYHIIIRPHPQSYISEKEMLDSLHAQTSHYENLKWDNRTDNIHAFAQSSLIIGDFSGVLFDYLALFSKPIITAEFHFNVIGYDLEDTSHKTPWVANALREISTSIAPSDFGNIKDIIDSTLKDKLQAQNRAKYKELLWHYQGCGGERTAIELIKIHKRILEESLGEEIYTHKQILAVDKLLQNAESQNFPLPCGGGQRGWVDSANAESNKKNGENITNSANQINLDCHDSASQNLAMTENIADSANRRILRKFAKSKIKNTHPLAPSAREGGVLNLPSAREGGADSANRTKIAKSPKKDAK